MRVNALNVSLMDENFKFFEHWKLSQMRSIKNNMHFGFSQ